jgi:hypothetical protein
MAYDSMRRRSVLFGGYNTLAGGFFADTWELGTDEICNGLDDDYDGIIPPNEIDHDGDGYVACSPWVGSDPDILGGGDCDDTNSGIHPATTEICNGLDDNCDGTVDSFSTTCGVGECASSGLCVNGTDSCVAGQPSSEVCDGRDNDCDGLVDNGVVPCCVTPSSSIVAWWSGDGNAMDLVGSNHGTLSGGTSFASGAVGEAFSFDGVGTYVDIPHATSIFFADDQPFSLEAWFMPMSDVPSYFVLKNAAYGIKWQGSDQPLLFFNGNNHYSLRTSWEIGRWYHVAVVDDGSTSVKLYVDGVLDGSEDGPARNPNRFPCRPGFGYCFSLQFGAWYEPLACGGNCIQFFHGAVDEVALYDRALTAAEISAIYQAGNFGKCLPEDADGDGFPVLMDCDDSNPTVFPGAPQLCDGLNNDCGDPAWPAVQAAEADTDGDGHLLCAGDCDDSLASVYPGAPQNCDGLNNDCNAPGWPSLTGTNEADNDGDGLTACQGDCNDVDPLVHPGATEVCSGIDDDCNGSTDEDAQGIDSDSDGIHNACDNCRFAYNPTQQDSDHDGIGNACDNCIAIPNIGQADLDADQRGDVCDNCPSAYNPFQDDYDTDKVGDVCDDCIFDSNPDQSDIDSDLEGDVCDLNDGLILVSLTDPYFVNWQPEAGFISFNQYRGDLLGLLQAGSYTQDPAIYPLANRNCGLFDSFVLDGPDPGLGQGVFYLVTGISGGIESSLGTNSAGNPRINSHPCP